MSENVVRLRPRQEAVPIQQPGPIDVALALMQSRQNRGVTWKDLDLISHMGHGPASGALSRLHQDGRAARLREKRDRCYIYVLPEWVGDRQTSAPAKNSTSYLLDDMASALRNIPTKCHHQHWHPRCRSCDIRLLLHRYDNR